MWRMYWQIYVIHCDFFYYNVGFEIKIQWKSTRKKTVNCSQMY